MNQLDPALKRLFRWSRQGEAPGPSEMPDGFAEQLARAGLREGLAASESPNPALVGAIGWFSTATIVAGLIVLFQQNLHGDTVLDFTPAYQFVVQSFML